MGLGTLYGVGDTVGLRTPLWGWGRHYGAEDTLCGAVFCTGLYWSILGGAAQPPPPRWRSQFLFPTPKGEMGGNGGGGRQFWGKISAFWGFLGPHFGAKSGHLGPKGAIWGQKSPIGGKRRSFFGVRTPHLGQKL